MSTRPAPAPAVTHYASVRAMAEWFAAAAPGAAMKYASGPGLDHREGAAQLAGQWGREGKVHPYFVRVSAGQLDFFVRRQPRSAEAVAAAPHPALPGRGPQSLDGESPEGRVYALLRRCANLAQPCPSHEDIAERLSFRDRKEAEYRTRLLIERGLIRVDWPARTGPRIVTIVATGRQTSFETRGSRAPQDERNSKDERSR